MNGAAGADAQDEAGWRRRVAAARSRGDHLAAYDAALGGLAHFPESMHLHHAAILALARSGATRGAREHLQRLAERIDALADPVLGLDFAALDGRLHKDDWARRGGAAALGSASRSADAYAAAFARYGEAYPAVNAATMMLAAGRDGEAVPLARAALELADAGPPGYWPCATAAEAALILRDEATARDRLARAARFASGNLDEVAATRRQMREVARLAGIGEAVLDGLPVPAVAYWLDGPGPAGGGAARPAGPGLIAFGTLVGPADVERASALLDEGAEVNLVLPCEPPAWTASLDPADARSVGPLFDRLVGRASGVVAVTREGHRDEPAARRLCRRQARGLAILRARSLAVPPRRIAWGAGGAGTDRVVDDAEPAEDARPSGGTDGPGRLARAIVFADVRGFSRLDEREQLSFLHHVVGGFAEVLKACPAVEYAETAGDGLYVVLDDVAAAAHCCFGLQGVLEPARRGASGLPAHLGLRVSAHVGPVYRVFDPVIGRHKFCGSEVIRTARIEPVTPVGEVYVTEQFAASLADLGGGSYVCDYAGRQPMAKGFGTCRMYALRPTQR